jgi:threonine dehydratase
MTKHYGGQKGLTESELLKMRDIVNQIHFDLPLTREHWQNFSANKMRGIYTRVQLDKQLKREAESLEAAKARKAHKAASIAE